MSFSKLPPGFTAVIIGASRGIGAEFARQLLGEAQCARVVAASRHAESSDELPASAKLRRVTLDVTREEDFQALASYLADNGIQPQLLIYTVGILHDAQGMEPEKRAADIRLDKLQAAFAANVFGAMLMARYLLPLVSRQQPALIAQLSARVGSIGDNRLGGWYAYRASKAALNQHMKTLAVELRRSHKQACVVNLHPGTTDTALSAPFQGGVPAGKLFTAEFACRQMLAILKGLGPEDSGRFIAWDGKDIEW